MTKRARTIRLLAVVLAGLGGAMEWGLVYLTVMLLLGLGVLANTFVW